MKLRTISLIAAMFLFFLGPIANAQIEVGLKGGLNATTLGYSDFDINDINADSLNLGEVPPLAETEYNFGFNAGVYALIDLGVVNIMPEILYSVKGAKKMFTSFTGDDVDASLHYLSIPILVGIDIADIFTIQVGPQFGFLMSGDLVSGDDSFEFQEAQDTDVSAALGVMFDWPGLGHLTARYQHGLTPAVQLKAGDGSDYNYFNRNFQVSLGLPVYSTDKDRKALIP